MLALELMKYLRAHPRAEIVFAPRPGEQRLIRDIRPPEYMPVVVGNGDGELYFIDSEAPAGRQIPVFVFSLGE